MVFFIFTPVNRRYDSNQFKYNFVIVKINSTLKYYLSYKFELLEKKLKEFLDKQFRLKLKA